MESDDDDRLGPEKSSSPRFIHEKLPNNGGEISPTKEAIVTLTTPIKLTGAYRRKDKWSSEITNPFTKRKNYLGTFNTPEEASNAFAAKKLEFQNDKRTLIGIDDGRHPTKSSSNKRPRVDHEIIINNGEGSPSSKEEEGNENLWRPESSPVKRPRVFDYTFVKSDSGDEKTSTKEANMTGTTQIIKLVGAYRQKSGRWKAEIKNPFDNHRRIHLGMFNTAEEASNAFLAKKLEFQRRRVAGEQIKVGQCKQARIGACRQKSGKWRSEIKNPFDNNRPINLGMFDTPEETSNAFLAKKLEFQKRKEAGGQMIVRTPTECKSVRSWEQSDQCAESSYYEVDGRKLENSTINVYAANRLEFLQRKEGLIDAPEYSFEEGNEDLRRAEKSSIVKRPRVFDKELVKGDSGDEKSSTREANLTWTTQTTKLIGAYRQKSGKWRAEIKNPFDNRRRIHLGMFDTPEEASNAYLAKKLEFQRRRVAGEQIKVGQCNQARIGAYRQKSGKWRSEIKNPFGGRPSHLGMFDTPEEASNAFLAKKLEFQKQKEAGLQIIVPTPTESKSVRSWEQNDHCAESSYYEVDGQKVENSTLNHNGKSSCSNKEVDHTLRGLRLQKSGRWGARINDPFSKREIWLGTFDTLDEASNVYSAKRLEFRQHKEGLIKAPEYSFEEGNEDLQRPENSSSVKRPRVFHKKLVKSVNGDEKTSTKEANLTRTTQTTKLIGAYRQKSGRWRAEIKNPFDNRRIHLGMFDTPEEASNAFLAKRQEFQKRKEAGEQITVGQCKQARICIVRTPTECEFVRSWEQSDQCAESSSYGGDSRNLENSTLNNYENDQLTMAESSSIEINTPKLVHEILQNSRDGVECSSGEEAVLALTNDPFTKHQIWLNTFDTPAEASKVYAVKRLEFDEQKEAQICVDRAQPEYEPLRCGQQIDDSQISEQIMIDNNGFLLGEFSNLDDELRIL